MKILPLSELQRPKEIFMSASTYSSNTRKNQAKLAKAILEEGIPVTLVYSTLAQEPFSRLGLPDGFSELEGMLRPMPLEYPPYSELDHCIRNWGIFTGNAFHYNINLFAGKTLFGDAPKSFVKELEYPVSPIGLSGGQVTYSGKLGICSNITGRQSNIKEMLWQDTVFLALPKSEDIDFFYNFISEDAIISNPGLLRHIMLEGDERSRFMSEFRRLEEKLRDYRVIRVKNVEYPENMIAANCLSVGNNRIIMQKDRSRSYVNEIIEAGVEPVEIDFRLENRHGAPFYPRHFFETFAGPKCMTLPRY